MSWLHRLALREIRAAWGPALCVALLTGVVVVLVAGGERTRRMILETREATYASLGHGDLELRFAPTFPGVAEIATQLEGVGVAEERLLLPGVIEMAGRRTLPALVYVLPPAGAPRLERLRLLLGRLPRPEEAGVAIDRSLAQDRLLEPDDALILALGEKRQSLPITGVFLSPEHVLRPVHPEYAFPLRDTVGIVAISARAATLSKHAGRVDSLVVKLADGADAAAIQAALTQSLPVSIIETLRARERPGHVFTEQILATFDIYMPSTAAMVVGIALVLLVLTVGRVLRRQRAAFGTLAAMGHAPDTMARAFLIVGLLPAAGGVLLGIATHGLFARALFSGYAAAVGLPPPVDPGVGWMLGVTVAVCLLTSGLAAYVPALLLARQRPAQLLAARGWASAEKAAGPLTRAATRVGEILRVPLSILLGLTHILRRRGVTLLAVVGLGGSFALVMAFLLVQHTRRAEVEGAVKRMGLDATVHFRTAVDEQACVELAQRVEGEAEPLLSQRAVVAAGDRTAVRRVLMIAPGRWVRQQRLVRGRPFERADEAAILIDRWFARHHELDLGDRVTVFPYPDAPEGTDLEVIGILQGVTQGFAVLPLETGQAIYGMQGLVHGAHIASPLGADELERRLWLAEDVEAVFALERAAVQVRAMFDATENLLRWVLGMALGIAALFLGVLAGVDAADRAHDFAVLRALGWRGRSIVSVCMTEVLARGALALLLAVPLAPLLANLLLRRLAAAQFPDMTLATPAWVFLLVCGGVLAVLPLGGIPALRGATRVTPARALRRLTTE